MAAKRAKNAKRSRTAVRSRKPAKAKTAKSKTAAGAPAKSRVAPDDAALRRDLVELLRGGGAHLTLDAALQDLPAELRGVTPPGAPHSSWQLLEHLRIAQRDILEFSRNPQHVSPEFPAGYWPATVAPPDDAAWDASVQAFRADLAAMEGLVTSPAANLLARFSHGDGQTLAREAMLLADHNAYHLGQLVVVRQLLGAWKG